MKEDKPDSVESLHKQIKEDMSQMESRIHVLEEENRNLKERQELIEHIQEEDLLNKPQVQEMVKAAEPQDGLGGGGDLGPRGDVKPQGDVRPQGRDGDVRPHREVGEDPRLEHGLEARPPGGDSKPQGPPGGVGGDIREDYQPHKAVGGAPGAVGGALEAVRDYEGQGGVAGHAKPGGKVGGDSNHVLEPPQVKEMDDPADLHRPPRDHLPGPPGHHHSPPADAGHHHGPPADPGSRGPDVEAQHVPQEEAGGVELGGDEGGKVREKEAFAEGDNENHSHKAKKPHPPAPDSAVVHERRNQSVLSDHKTGSKTQRDLKSSHN